MADRRLVSTLGSYVGCQLLSIIWRFLTLFHRHKEVTFSIILALERHDEVRVRIDRILKSGLVGHRWRFVGVYGCHCFFDLVYNAFEHDRLLSLFTAVDARFTTRLDLLNRCDLTHVDARRPRLPTTDRTKKFLQE